MIVPMIVYAVENHGRLPVSDEFLLYYQVSNLQDAGYDIMIALVTSISYHIYERKIISQALVDKVLSY